jgi:hypothetical protein
VSEEFSQDGTMKRMSDHACLQQIALSQQVCLLFKSSLVIMILPSWRAFYVNLTKDLPLVTTTSFKELLKTDDDINKCKTDLATIPHCAILAVFPGYTINQDPPQF